ALDAKLRLRLDDRGLPLLTTLDQMQGYLETQTDAERNLPGHEYSRDWKGTISKGISDFLQGPPTHDGVWNLIHNPKPGIESLRQEQNEWTVAARIASSAGVDVEMLIRSAKFMKQHVGDPVMAGAINAATATIVPENYDHLFA